MKFGFIDANRAWPVAAQCRVLGVSRAGYYAWRERQPSKRERKDAHLRVVIREVFERSRRTYGSPRVYDELRDRGFHVSRKRVIRLMQEMQLVARPKKRIRRPAVAEGEQVVAANVLARDFAADAPNRRWVGDTTELRAGGLRLFLAAVLDLYSRFVVGWAVSLVNDRHLVERALQMAVKRRGPEPGLLHHSDQGSPYTSEDYQRVLEQRGITCSMSRKGDCFDNAVSESWFSTLKFELGETFDSPAAAKAELFDYIEVFYNQERRHSYVHGQSPGAYERAYWDRSEALAA